MNQSNKSIYKNILFICCILLIFLYCNEIIFGKEKCKNDENIIVIDKNNNSISIGGIDNSGHNNESEIKKETTINDMVIINNNDKIYIKHRSDNKNINEDEDEQK